MARRARCAPRTLPAAPGLVVRTSRPALGRSDPAAARQACAMKWTFLAVLAVVALVLSVVLGPAAVPLGEVLRSDIVWNLRAPRALLAFLVGGSLGVAGAGLQALRSEEHTSELQSLRHLVCRLLLEKKKSNAALRTTHWKGEAINSMTESDTPGLLTRRPSRTRCLST